MSLSSVGFVYSLITASAFAKPYRAVSTDNPLVSVRHPGPAWPLFLPCGIQMEGVQGRINSSFPVAMFLYTCMYLGTLIDSPQVGFLWTAAVCAV